MPAPSEPSAAPPATPVVTPVPTWRRAVRWIYVALVLVAFGVAIISRRTELVDQLSDVETGPLVLSVLAALAGVGVSGLIWRRMLHGLGSALPLGVASKVFFVAQLGKYMPGSLWPVLAQTELGRDHGVPMRSAVAAQSLFMWVHLVTGAILGVPAMAILGLVPGWAVAAPLALIPLLFPGPLTAVMDGILRRVRRRPLPGRPTGRDMAAAVGWAMVMWMLYGLHVHFAVDALEFTGPGITPVLAVTGVFAAAWSAGFVFLVAPAGAGARELILIAGLSTVAAPETAFTVTLLSRLILSVADGLWGGAGLAAGSGRRRARTASAAHPAEPPTTPPPTAGPPTTPPSGLSGSGRGGAGS